jgi:hypothetical protein
MRLPNSHPVSGLLFPRLPRRVSWAAGSSACTSSIACSRGAALATLPKAVRRNPSVAHRRDNRIRRAIEAYEGFHWGEKPERILKRKLSPAPRVGVKLGKLYAVTYETKKNGERALWEHEFGEEGGKKPDLVMDVDNKRLHIVGGSYDVRNEGIVD